MKLEYICGLFLWRVRPCLVGAMLAWMYVTAIAGSDKYHAATLGIVMLVYGFLFMHSLMSERDSNGNLTKRFLDWQEMGWN